MNIYPYNGPIILNDQTFVDYGGQTGTFSHTSLQNSYWLAEMQVSAYIGTFLLPTVVTGSYPYQHTSRLKMDYGYINEILAVNIISRENPSNCDLTVREGCGYIYQDVYGYVDFKRITSLCSCNWWWFGSPYPAYTFNYPTYQIQVAYKAGLPTGTANQPGILEALTILAKIDLNEKIPGLVGENESAGDMPLTRYRSIEYAEGRKLTAFIRTNMGQSSQVMRAKMLIDMTVKKARGALLA